MQDITPFMYLFIFIYSLFTFGYIENEKKRANKHKKKINHKNSYAPIICQGHANLNFLSRIVPPTTTHKPTTMGDKTDPSNISFAEVTRAANGPPALVINFNRPQIIRVLNLFWYQRPSFRAQIT